jgi:hypothetical protein
MSSKKIFFSIWEAVINGASTLRYTAGEDAKQYIAGRKALSDKEIFAAIEQRFNL